MPGSQPTATRSAAELGPTATALLDAAERLFAERTIDGVSIREIVRASGRSNSYALHYHFGTREALIGAVLERRIRVLDAMRARRLDEREASGGEETVHGLIAMTIDVLAEVVRREPWGPDYVRVAAQALFSPSISLRALIDPQAWSAQMRINDALRRLLPHLPARVFDERIRILSHEAIYAIARWVQSNGTVTSRSERRFEETVRVATDFLAAGLAAPSSVR
jgi:AcrR family transcriptional regulator